MFSWNIEGPPPEVTMPFVSKQQYVFSFGRQLTVYDNRMQAFLREGMLAAEPSVSVDSMFRVLSTLETNIQQEELY